MADIIFNNASILDKNKPYSMATAQEIWGSPSGKFPLPVLYDARPASQDDITLVTQPRRATHAKGDGAKISDRDKMIIKAEQMWSDAVDADYDPGTSIEALKTAYEAALQLQQTIVGDPAALKQRIENSLDEIESGKVSKPDGTTHVITPQEVVSRHAQIYDALEDMDALTLKQFNHAVVLLRHNQPDDTQRQMELANVASDNIPMNDLLKIYDRLINKDAANHSLANVKIPPAAGLQAPGESASKLFAKENGFLQASIGDKVTLPLDIAEIYLGARYADDGSIEYGATPILNVNLAFSYKNKVLDLHTQADRVINAQNFKVNNPDFNKNYQKRMHNLEQNLPSYQNRE